MSEASRGWNAHKGSEWRQQQEIDVLGINAGVFDTAPRGFVAQIACGLVRLNMPAFQDTGSLDDPIRIAAEPLAQMVVGDNGIWDVAAGAQNADTRHAAAGEPGLKGTFAVH